MSVNAPSTARARARLRDLGARIGFFPTGPENGITDVAGVRVGHVTLVRGDGPLVPGEGPVRTGVTAVIPAAGDVMLERVYAASYVLNGAGEATGLAQIAEWGLCETPIVLTSTMCVGRVADGAVAWLSREHPQIGQALDVVIPVVAECDDSFLNDAVGRHVTQDDVFAALDSATAGPVPMGCVGAGTGMQTFDFAGGIGTSSRVARAGGEAVTVGALVLSNFGDREYLRVDGVPVGRLIAPKFRGVKRRGRAGSIVILIATDAPLLPQQLARLCRRAPLAIGRVGGYVAHNSGDIVVAWSTANRVPRGRARARETAAYVLDDELDPIFAALIDAVEEAIVEAMIAGREMTGHSGHYAPALPHDDVAELLSRFRPPDDAVADDPLNGGVKSARRPSP